VTFAPPRSAARLDGDGRPPATTSRRRLEHVIRRVYVGSCASTDPRRRKVNPLNRGPANARTLLRGLFFASRSIGTRSRPAELSQNARGLTPAGRSLAPRPRGPRVRGPRRPDRGARPSPEGRPRPSPRAMPEPRGPIAADHAARKGQMACVPNGVDRCRRITRGRPARRGIRRCPRGSGRDDFATVRGGSAWGDGAGLVGLTAPVRGRCGSLA
jgi:hypothetical protein